MITYYVNFRKDYLEMLPMWGGRTSAPILYCCWNADGPSSLRAAARSINGGAQLATTPCACFACVRRMAIGEAAMYTSWPPPLCGVLLCIEYYSR